MYHRSMKERLSALEQVKANLEATARVTNGLSAVDTVSTPSFAARYRAAIDALAETLNDPDLRPRAAEVLRTLIDRAMFTPRDDGTIEGVLEGELAKLLAFANGEKDERPGTNVPGRRLSVVAGRGFEPLTFRL